MNLTEKQISSKYIFKGRIISLRVDEAELPNGKTASREVVEHNGGVTVVPLTDNNEVIMVEQFRYACGRPVMEIPAGKIDKGETDPAAVAARELREETGYTAENIFLLGKINTSAAYSEEMISVYAMTGLTEGEQQLDADEALNVIKMPFKEAYDMAAAGRLIDAKTIAALLMAKEQLGL